MSGREVVAFLLPSRAAVLAVVLGLLAMLQVFLASPAAAFESSLGTTLDRIQTGANTAEFRLRQVAGTPAAQAVAHGIGVDEGSRSAPKKVLGKTIAKRVPFLGIGVMAWDAGTFLWDYYQVDDTGKVVGGTADDPAACLDASGAAICGTTEKELPPTVNKTGEPGQETPGQYCTIIVDRMQFGDSNTVSFSLSHAITGPYQYTLKQCMSAVSEDLVAQCVVTNHVPAATAAQRAAYPVGSIYEYRIDVNSYTSGTGVREGGRPCVNLTGHVDNLGGGIDVFETALVSIKSHSYLQPAGTGFRISPSNQVWVNQNAPADQSQGQTVITVTKDCVSQDGAVTTVQATSVPGSQTIPGVGCPPGTAPVSSSVYQGTAGDRGELLSTTELAPGAMEEFSECLGPASGGCGMAVMIDDVPCAPGVVECIDWMTVAEAQPERVKCLWGPYLLPGTDCDSLEHAYITEHGSSVGSSLSSPRPVTDTAGTPWPESSPFPGQVGYEQPQPGTEPGTGGLPSTGTNPAPYPGTDPALSPDSRTQQCFSQNWSWNPISWVFTPVKCALQWAFVPRPEKMAAATAPLRDTEAGQALDQWIAALNGMGAAFASTSGSCQGPALVLPEPMGTIYPASTCSEPMASFAMVFRTGLTALIVATGVLACVRLLSSGVGYSTGQGGEG